jgi:hypothetical protein
MGFELLGAGGSGLVSAVEAVSFEFDGNGRIDLANLLLAALGAHGDGIIAEGLNFGEIVSAVLATIVVSGHLNITFHDRAFFCTLPEEAHRKFILVRTCERELVCICERSGERATCNYETLSTSSGVTTASTATS